jgi:hypothetical protein
MEFPTEWAVHALTDFETAEARTTGPAGMELMVQARPNGRLLDHFRIATGGTSILEASVQLSDIIPSPNLNKWKMKYQFWARDTAIRRNMTTSAWKDVYSLIRENETRIEDDDGDEISTEEVLTELDNLPPSRSKSAVIRFATVIGEDQRMMLEMQSLPVALGTINGKPTFRG